MGNTTPTSQAKQKLCNVKYLAMSIAILHNYCLREQQRNGLLEWDCNSVQEFPYLPTIPNEHGQGPNIPMADEEDVNQQRYREVGILVMRSMMAERIRTLGLRRPGDSADRYTTLELNCE
jgi:hypothetical protein